MRTVGADASPTDPYCSDSGSTVWLSYTAAASGPLGATTRGSDYDTTLLVGQPDGRGGVDVIACNDDAAGGVHSAARFHAEAGRTYLFMVGAYYHGEGGQLSFQLELAPPPVEVDLLIERGQYDDDGQAIISGLMVCSSRLNQVQLHVDVRQVVGRLRIRGSGEAYLERCGPRGQRWTAFVESSRGTFGPEPATVEVSLFAADAYSYYQLDRQATLVLEPTVPPATPSPTPSPSPPPPTPSPSPTAEPTEGDSSG
ncbi:hypothetical protein BH23CHL7_BH23CHL7_16220 [soil metagenome]